MTAVCAYSDFFHFFRSWISDPRRVAAVAPSGDSLARLMTKQIDPSGGPVLELGAGTGVFTRALVARGVRECDLTLVDITQAADTPLEGFLIMLHSASSKRAAEIGREQIEKGHQKTLTDALAGDLAPQRAALMLSLVAGFQVMRQMIGLSALAEAERSDLIKVLAPLFKQLIEGTRASGDTLSTGT